MSDTLQDAFDRGQLLPVPCSTTPYWRTKPHRIDEYRSTEHLPKECDVAIVGAGMSGVATAYHLTKLAGSHKPSIVILEARQVCSGATGRNGGHVKIRTPTMRDSIKRHGLGAAEELAAFVVDQTYALKDTVESELLDCEFELRRSFDVFIDESEAKEAIEFYHDSVRAKHRWVRDVDVISDKYAEQVTSIRGARAALSSSACSFWPYKFVTELLARLLDAKLVELHTWTSVTNVEYGDMVDGVLLHTARGVIKAKKVIFATNAYTGGVCKQYADAITPIKGTACHITPNSPVSPHLSHTYNINYTHWNPARCVDYLNPRPDGGIVVGGAKWMFVRARDQWYGNWDDSTLLPGVRAHFDGLMQRYFAGWQDSRAVVDHLWTGIMGQTPDEQPHIGEVPGREEQQYIIAGFNGGGMASIFLSTKGLAEMVLGEASFEQTGIPRIFRTSEERLSRAVNS